ncbi:MAG: cell division protein FtsW [Cyclobacteriaceae bacterium]|nr:cell division protein FtsW [Cyclobacteriaceae bacterium]
MNIALKSWADRNLKGDPILWAIVFLLSVISVLVVYSSTETLAYKSMRGNTEHYLFRHGFLILLSLIAMWLAHRVDYRYYSRISTLALWVSVPLLMYTWLFGTRLNEASRWLTIPLIDTSFQPSDLAKLALITHLAAMLSKRQQNINDIKETLIPVLMWTGVICGLIAMSNVSTAVLLFSTSMIVLFIGRVPVHYLFMLMLVGLLAGGVAFKIGERGDTVINRVKDFVNPQEIPYQAKQSYIAIAKGGITGKGPGNSDQKDFLPHPYSDFIFSIIVEEYGVIGGTFTILLYLALLYRSMLAASKSENAFGGLLAAGLSVALVIQAMINVCVSVGLLPITGLPLPLISMGGTSLLFTGLAVGIIISVSRGETDQIKTGFRGGNTFKRAAA